MFVKVSDRYAGQVDPMILYSAIMADVHEHKKIVTKSCHRLIPVQKALKAETCLIRAAVQSLVDQHVDPCRQVRWMCQYKSRF